MSEIEKPWSLSQRGMYKKCPAQFDYRHNQKLPYPSGPAAERGIAHHAMVESILTGGRALAPEGVVLNSWTLQRVEEMRAQGYAPELKMAFTRYWIPCDWKSPLAWVRGVIDAHKKIERTIFMGEWKTGKIYEDHEDQRRLYLLMALCHDYEVETAHIRTIYMDQKHETSMTMHRDMVPSETKFWEEDVEQMRRDTFFSPRPGFYCRWCPYSASKGGPCPH